MSFAEIRVDGVDATVLLNRPDVLNAIDDALRTDLLAALDTIARDDQIRALVLTGKGKGFCAGGDIRGMEERLKAPAGSVAINGWRRQQRTHHFISSLHMLPKPTIAAVNGAAAGLGCDLALACDFIIASPKAMLTMSYVHRGLIPDGGGMYFLPRRVGLVKAKELIFSGRRLKPEEALEIGMIDRIATEADTLLDEAANWARELSQGSAPAIALAKTILNETFETPRAEVFQKGSEAQGICYTTSEHQDSVRAFLEQSRQRAAEKSGSNKP